MQDSIYKSKGLSKISYLRAKGLLNKDDSTFLRFLLDKQDYSTFEEIIEKKFNENDISPSMAENFVDLIKNNNYGTERFDDGSIFDSNHIKNTDMNKDSAFENTRDIITNRTELSFYKKSFKEEQVKTKELSRKIFLAEEENSILKLEHEKLKSQLQQNRIDEKIPGYVREVKEKLNNDDKFFIKMSDNWAVYGAIACIFAIISAFATFSHGIEKILENEKLSSIALFYIFTRGLLGIGILSWLSYICFNNSHKYTDESIRRKDRQHALMFGQIFLQIYGSTASKDDVTNVFKDWNMSGNTAFSGKTEQPPSVYNLFSQIKDILSVKNKKPENTTKTEDNK